MATVPLLVFDLKVPPATWKLGSSNPQRALGEGQIRSEAAGKMGQTPRGSCPGMVTEAWRTAPPWPGNQKSSIL